MQLQCSFSHIHTHNNVCLRNEFKYNGEWRRSCAFLVSIFSIQ